MKHLINTFLLLVVLLMGCKKEVPPDPVTGNLSIKFDHHVDGQTLSFEDTYYSNAAGNQYRVLMLKYIISGVSLYRDGKRAFRQSTPPKVISGKYEDTQTLLLKNIPIGSYDSISFSLGAVREFNYDNAFELGYDDLGMYWPTSMGGGYHFMRFEGHWKDGADYGGYAFHIGQNENLITTGFPVSIMVELSQSSNLGVEMNLNEWFENPHLYNLKIESGYTMGDTVKMNMLVQNGHNVFSIKN